MATSTGNDVYYDPYDATLLAEPHPIFRRLRDEAPVYYNPKLDFFALSRYDDVERGFVDNETYISGRGNLLEFIKSGVKIPPGSVIWEDPPAHTIHRALLARMFTPKKVAAIEPEVRRFCVETLDQFVGAGGFDFIADLALQVPMRVIGMLLGIPWEDQEKVRDRYGRPTTHHNAQDVFDEFLNGGLFVDYLDWRLEHPSDDVMTDLVNVEFEDETGTTRRLTRSELLMYINILASAGNETTGRLIGWTGKLLSDHPSQRREIVDDPSLIANAIEEILRFEPPAVQDWRSLARDTTVQGQTIPNGSAVVLLMASANRDDRHFDDPDRFDIHRKPNHLSFARGPHFCLGASIARLEGRVVLEEVLKRFPDWEVDTDKAKLAVSPTFRGWETLPVVIG